MNITLQESKVFSFTIGNKTFDGFTVADEWNGMQKLKRQDGMFLIIGIGPAKITDVLDAIMFKKTEKTTVVISGSSELIAEIMEAEKEAESRIPKEPAKTYSVERVDGVEVLFENGKSTDLTIESLVNPPSKTVNKPPQEYVTPGEVFGAVKEYHTVLLNSEQCELIAAKLNRLINIKVN